MLCRIPTYEHAVRIREHRQDFGYPVGCSATVHQQALGLVMDSLHVIGRVM
jgi:hypothetical protein